MRIKRIKMVGIAVGLVALQSLAVMPGSTHALDETWGPERDMYTWESPADHVTFNSISNNPFIGNETNFVRVKEYVEGSNAGDENWQSWTDNVTVEPGKEYEVFIYYHNNASESLNADGTGLALNTRVASSFPTKLEANQSGIIKGSVSSTNASPVAVWDTAFFNADQTIYLSYIPNTATLHPSPQHYNAEGELVGCDGTLLDGTPALDGTVLDPDSFFASYDEVGNSDSVGAMIACYDDDELWGVQPGCNDYAGYITYRVRADQPAFWTEKTVSRDGANEYVEYLDANPGDVLDFKIYYKNTGTTNQTNVVAHDELPSGMSLVSGSVQVTTPAGTVTLTPEQESQLFSSDSTGSLNIGDFYPNEEAIITYKVKVGSEDEFQCGQSELYNDATVQTANGSEYDKVQVIVNKECEELPTPSEMPQTGPLEIAMVAIIIVGISAGGYYFYRTKKTLKTVENTAKDENAQSSTLEGDSNEQQSATEINKENDDQ